MGCSDPLVGLAEGLEPLSALARLRLLIARVPRGKVVTYGQVAAAAGFPRGARLTVWALQGEKGLPWHRVVAAGGRIALLREQGREQRFLLEMEGVKFRGSRVRMDLHNWTPAARQASRAGRGARGGPLEKSKGTGSLRRARAAGP